MVYTIALPQTLPAGLAMGFHILVTTTGALPYNVDGVATVGIEGEGAGQLPSLVGLDRSHRSAPSVPYEGSAMLSELLDSSPRALQISSLPLVESAGNGADLFVRASEADISIRDLISEHSGSSQLWNLAYKYSEAVLNLKRLESAKGDAMPSRNEMSDFLGRLSPVALKAAEKSAANLVGDSPLPHLPYARHCLLFLAGALSATFRHGECSRYAIKALGRMGNFFSMQDVPLYGGEGFAIKASGLEIIAEMLRIHRLPGEDAGFIYPQQIFPEIAHTWIDHMEKHPSSPDYEGIFLRALNAAQWQPDYDSLECIFLTALKRQTDDLVAAQFLIRTAWAVLMNEDGDRPEAERWELVSEYIKAAEGHLGSGNVRGGDQLADVASRVRARTQGYAEELNTYN